MEAARKELPMSVHSPLIHRTFRITIDIETTINAEPDETMDSSPQHVHYHQALVQRLLAHPELLNHLLRCWTVDALGPARKLLEAEYGWGPGADQPLLQPIIAELEPAAQAYFTEELEDGFRAYCFDGSEATIKGFRLTQLDEK
jgi:hypothetical protein